MNEFLKGNFKTKKKVDSDGRGEENSLEKRFEKEALAKLGGSISFVSKKKVLWDQSDFENSEKNKGE